MFACLKLLEKGFLLSCLLLSKDSPWQICLDLWMLHLLAYSYTFDFSAPDAYACWWLGHGGFIYSHRPISESTTSFWPSCVLSHFSLVQRFVTLWTAVCQSPLSMGFFRQEHWSGLPRSPSGDLPTQGLNPCLLCLLIGELFTISVPWEAPDHQCVAHWGLLGQSLWWQTPCWGPGFCCSSVCSKLVSCSSMFVSQLWSHSSVSRCGFTWVARYRSDICESPGLCHLNRTPSKLSWDGCPGKFLLLSPVLLSVSVQIRANLFMGTSSSLWRQLTCLLESYLP